MWTPRWFYEMLPAIYAGGSGACLTWFDQRSPGLLSAGLLFTAAALVTFWRRNRHTKPGLAASHAAAARRARLRCVAARGMRATP